VAIFHLPVAGGPLGSALLPLRLLLRGHYQNQKKWQAAATVARGTKTVHSSSGKKKQF